MSSPRPSFRTWWQPPRPLRDRPEHRQVTFLELFYDLVYVVIIAELAHALATHMNWAGLGEFAFLFAIVWWAWLNGTIYHDLHGNNDVRTRVFTFLQMFSVIAMAVFAHDALGETADGFALAYAAFQLILTYLWWRTGVHDPDHRPLSGRYTVGFLVSTLLFVASVFLPENFRLYLWGTAVLISLLLPVYIFSLGRGRPEVQEQIDLSTDHSHSLVERFGLFTIIVLGEVIVGVVSGLTGHHDLSWTIGGTASLSALIAIGIWWVYFDSVSHRLPKHDIGSVTRWNYLHLPLTIGIAAAGAAVLNVVEHAGEPLPGDVRWLLAGAISVTLLSVTALIHTIRLDEITVRTHHVAGRVALLSAIAIGLLGWTRLDTFPFLTAIVLLLLAPVVAGIRVWVALMSAEH